MALPEPETSVCLTTCPRGDCQRVAFVCVGPALAERGCPPVVAMDCKEFTRRSSFRPKADVVREWLCWTGLLLVAPALLLREAFACTDSGFAAYLFMSAAPPALLGVIFSFATAVDIYDNAQRRTHALAARNAAFPNARWLRARISSSSTISPPESPPAKRPR